MVHHISLQFDKLLKFFSIVHEKYLQMRHDVHIIIDESQVRNFSQPRMNDSSDGNILLWNLVLNEKSIFYDSQCLESRWDVPKNLARNIKKLGGMRDVS